MDSCNLLLPYIFSIVASKRSLVICFENSFEIRETGPLVKFSPQVSVNRLSNYRGLT